MERNDRYIRGRDVLYIGFFGFVIFILFLMIGGFIHTLIPAMAFAFLMLIIFTFFAFVAETKLTSDAMIWALYFGILFALVLGSLLNYDSCKLIH